MNITKNKISTIVIALLLIIAMGSSLILIPNASAHTPSWNIPTYAYINVEPNPIGIGQSLIVYMWLDCVFGAAGGTTAVTGTSGATASAALLANDYRFHNYQLTITAPDGTTTSQTFATVQDTTSSQYTKFTPTQVGTYTLNFTFPGQAFNQYDHYANSVLVNDTYLPSSASTTLTVQQSPIPDATTSEPLPTDFWSHPIYGENSNWFAISSNWLGSGFPPPSGYTYSPATFQMYHGDAIGPLTSHVMWTQPLQFGGVVGGNQFVAGGSNPAGPAQGAAYFEGSSYAPRFYNPIIINGYLYYTVVASFTGSPITGGTATGPTICVNLRTGQQLWSSMTIPQLSFGYIYNLWDPDQHGVYPPVLVASVGGGVTGIPATWELFDAYTGDSLFNITGVPSGIAVAGPSGEQLRYVIANAGTAANPQWYLAQWNMSKLWLYDVNPYTGAGSVSPSIINAANGALISLLPIPQVGETGTLPNGTSIFIPYGSALTANANIGTAAGLATSSFNPTTTYDWNFSIPWLNTMPLQPTYSTTTGQITPATPGSNPVTVIAASYGDMMLCRNGSLPTGFPAASTGYPQLPYTMFAVNLNASRGQIGSILWMQNYNPPAGNITLQLCNVDFQTRVFAFQYYETVQWVGYSLDTGNLLWGPTPSEVAFNYYDWSGYNPGVMAYGNLYSGGFGGVTYCYNDLTGKVVWTYGNGGAGNSTNAGFNTSYGDYPTFVQSIANGVVYLATDEHTIPDPLYKGATIEAVNATTGQQIWQLSGYPSEWAYSGSDFVVADGYLTTMNGYDNNIYSIGRGSSATTVQAPLTAITAGTNVVIQGTIMDTSAGTLQTTVKADFPNGVPVASDASMKDWMAYVYQQQAAPTNFTGVPVSIDAVDPNGNNVHVGDATTNANGLFSYVWQPPNIPGKYSITATFVGTNGYWGSNAQTTMIIQNAPSATAAPIIAPESVVDTYFVPSVIAIIVVIIIGFALLFLSLRKHP